MFGIRFVSGVEIIESSYCFCFFNCLRVPLIWSVQLLCSKAGAYPRFFWKGRPGYLQFFFAAEVDSRAVCQVSLFWAHVASDSAHQMGPKDGDVMQAVEKARAAVGEPQVLLSEISSLDGFVIFG